MRTSPGNYFVAATLSYKERELCHVSKIQHSELQKSPFIPPYKGGISISGNTWQVSKNLPGGRLPLFHQKHFLRNLDFSRF